MSKIARTIWKWRQEWLGLPLALGIFLFSPALLYMIDRTAGTWDVGVLQALSVASVQLIVANTVARIGAAVNYRFIFGSEPRKQTWYALLFGFYFLAYLALVVAL